MSQDTRRKVAKQCSLVAIIAGIAVLLAWIMDIGIIKSIHPSWISMKFDTAIAFILSGIILYHIALAGEGRFDLAQVVISITCFTLILLMGTLCISTFLGVHTGAEDLFVKETKVTAKTIVPGRPSIPTMLDFMALALAGVLTISGMKNTPRVLKGTGFFVASTGVIALAGYACNLPLLYYYLNGINSAMAFHTAALFVTLGIGLICLSG